VAVIKKQAFFLFLGVFIVASLGCAQTPKPVFGKDLATPGDKGALKSHVLLTLLLDMQTQLETPEKFGEEKNKTVVLDKIRRLSKLAKSVDHEKIFAAAKPKIPKTLFQDQFALAEKEFEAGHKEYARGLLQGSTASCLACHSQSTLDPKARTKW
jgi:hypothetical protein